MLLGAVIRGVLYKRVLFKISQNSQENTFARVWNVSFLENFANALKACNFIKKETLSQVFPVNFAKLFRTPFSQNTSRRSLSVVWECSLSFRIHRMYAIQINFFFTQSKKKFLQFIFWHIVSFSVCRFQKSTFNEIN